MTASIDSNSADEALHQLKGVLGAWVVHCCWLPEHQPKCQTLDTSCTVPSKDNHGIPQFIKPHRTRHAINT